MNNNYFRVTAYHEQANVSVIVDSNGYYNALWELSAFLIKKGFTVIAVGKDGKFSDGNIPRAEVNADSFILRACTMGKPEQKDGTITILTRNYRPDKNA